MLYDPKILVIYASKKFLTKPSVLLHIHLSGYVRYEIYVVLTIKAYAVKKFCFIFILDIHVMIN